jgi:glycosyltransferase involved in cell wall biosynthesis
MHITYLAHSIIPSRQANSINVMKMCHAFAATGNQVRLLTPNFAATEPRVDDVHAFYGVAPTFSLEKLYLPSLPAGVVVSALQAISRLRRDPPDLLYSRSLNFCALVAPFVTAPLALEIHLALNRAERWRFRRLAAQPNFRGLVVITQALADWFAATFPGLDRQIFVAPDGADVPAANLTPVRLGRNGRMTVGYCGHLFDGKGIGLLVDLARAVPDADFHVVGGRAEDVAVWRRRAGELENLVFHGFLPNPEALRYVAAFDVAIAPYQRRVTVYERDFDVAPWMSPLKLFEYMAAGKAILSSDLPVLREILTDGENALLCPPDNLDAWIGALRRLRGIAERKRLGERARSDFQTKYTWYQRAEKIRAAVGAHN